MSGRGPHWGEGGQGELTERQDTSSQPRQSRDAAGPGHRISLRQILLFQVEVFAYFLKRLWGPWKSLSKGRDGYWLAFWKILSAGTWSLNCGVGTGKLYRVKLSWGKFFLKKPPCIQSPQAMCPILPNITVTYPFLCSLLGSKHWRRLLASRHFSLLHGAQNEIMAPETCAEYLKRHSPQTCSNCRLPSQSEIHPLQSFFPP